MPNSKSVNGLLYLYNGGEQPEIWSVNSVEQARQYAVGFQKAIHHVDGQSPQDVTRPKITKRNMTNTDDVVLPKKQAWENENLSGEYTSPHKKRPQLRPDLLYNGSGTQKKFWS